MKNLFLLALVSGIVILLGGSGTSYAVQSSVSGIASVPPALPLTIAADKASYSDGDKIVISGTVRDPVPGGAVTIQIRAPNNNVVLVGQIPLSADNTFAAEFSTGGSLWQDSGKYEINAKIGNKDAVATFQFSGYVPFEVMQVEGTDLSVSYKMIGGGQLLGVHPNTQSKSIVLTVKSEGNGTLIISLPRSVIDSKVDGKDSPFSTMANGIIVDHREQSGTSARTLTIPFGHGTHSITVVGTSVIPEFGPITGLIFAIALLSITVVSMKRGLRLIRFSESHM